MQHGPAGGRGGPPVSSPSPPHPSPAATAAADPPEDPPGTRPRSQGLRLGPQAEFSVDEPMANSSQLALPTMMRSSPKFRSAEASYSGSKFSRIFDPHVVLTPRVESTSLTTSGTPSQSARSPFLVSTVSARSSASSGVFVTKALIPSSTASRRVLAASAASRAETSPPSIFLASP